MMRNMIRYVERDVTNEKYDKKYDQIWQEIYTLLLSSLGVVRAHDVVGCCRSSTEGISLKLINASQIFLNQCKTQMLLRQSEQD